MPVVASVPMPAVGTQLTTPKANSGRIRAVETAEGQQLTSELTGELWLESKTTRSILLEKYFSRILKSTVEHD